MAQTFPCPACGAPVTYQGGSEARLPCPYCSNSVPVPEDLRAAQPIPPPFSEPEAPDAILPPPVSEVPPPQPVTAAPEAARWVRVLLILIVLSFVIPTCIGIAASVIGTIVAVVAPFVGLLFGN
jgi:endogenous inhibitor of DNA gyrase (YacG/DUF329 family)